MTKAIDATALRLNAKAADAASLAAVIEKRVLTCGPEDVVVEVKAAGINPSDVKAATGLMPYAVFPRTPGRDFAGVVVDGPPEWLGREVFGSSGAPGFRRAGMPTAQDTVLIMGLNGKVGQAAAQLATWRGARVIGVVRKDEPYEG